MARIAHAASAWAGNRRSGSGMCSRCRWHNSSVAQVGGAHTGSTWTADGSQAGRMGRNRVGEGHTPTLQTAWKRLRSRAIHHVAPHTIRWLASGIRLSKHRFTHDRYCLHNLKRDRSLFEACDSSLRGSFEISSAREPTPCHPCCSST